MLKLGDKLDRRTPSLSLVALIRDAEILDATRIDAQVFLEAASEIGRRDAMAAMPRQFRSREYLQNPPGQILHLEGAFIKLAPPWCAALGLGLVRCRRGLALRNGERFAHFIPVIGLVLVALHDA